MDATRLAAQCRSIGRTTWPGGKNHRVCATNSVSPSPSPLSLNSSFFLVFFCSLLVAHSLTHTHTHIYTRNTSKEILKKRRAEIECSFLSDCVFSTARQTCRQGVSTDMHHLSRKTSNAFHMYTYIFRDWSTSLERWTILLRQLKRELTTFMISFLNSRLFFSVYCWKKKGMLNRIFPEEGN